VIVALCPEAAGLIEASKDKLAWFGRVVTVAGANISALLTAMSSVAGAAGAAVSHSSQLTLSPPVTDRGTHDSDSGPTVADSAPLSGERLLAPLPLFLTTRIVVSLIAPFKAARIVAGPVNPFRAEAANVAVSEPFAMATVPGTLSALFWVVEMLTVAGAVALVRVREQVAIPPQDNVVGLQVTDESCAGASTVNEVAFDVPFSVAVTVAVLSLDTAPAVAMNVAVPAPAATGIAAGTPTAV
jgi:hypothetical protein